MSKEMYYVEGGKKADAKLHANILPSREGDRAFHRAAVNQLIKRGMTRQKAEKMLRQASTTL